MKVTRIEKIIKEGIESHSTAEEIALHIRTSINNDWYWSRKDVGEDIIE